MHVRQGAFICEAQTTGNYARWSTTRNGAGDSIAIEINPSHTFLGRPCSADTGDVVIASSPYTRVAGFPIIGLNYSDTGLLSCFGDGTWVNINSTTTTSMSN